MAKRTKCAKKLPTLPTISEFEKTRIAATISAQIGARSNGCLNSQWCGVVGNEILGTLLVVYDLVRKE